MTKLKLNKLEIQSFTTGEMKKARGGTYTLVCPTSPALCITITCPV